MMTQVKEVSLEDLLLAREQRAQRQKELIERHKAGLISFTVNIPGNNKDSQLSRRIFDAGLSAIKRGFQLNGIKIIHEEANYKFTGAEAFVSVDADEIQIKKICVEIEENHPMGRLFDIDVIDRKCNLIQRDTLKKRKRKCLLCEEDAYSCARSKKHRLEELLFKIKEIADEYFKNAG
jgi:holo-ACP synthase